MYYIIFKILNKISRLIRSRDQQVDALSPRYVHVWDRQTYIWVSLFQMELNLHVGRFVIKYIIHGFGGSLEQIMLCGLSYSRSHMKMFTFCRYFPYICIRFMWCFESLAVLINNRGYLSRLEKKIKPIALKQIYCNNKSGMFSYHEQCILTSNHCSSSPLSFLNWKINNIFM